MMHQAANTLCAKPLGPPDTKGQVVRSVAPCHVCCLHLRHQICDPAMPFHRNLRVQVFALMYYIMSYFPGGTQGMQLVLSMAGRTILSCFGSATRSSTG
jgi:hypothetical protein